MKKKKYLMNIYINCQHLYKIIRKNLKCQINMGNQNKKIGKDRVTTIKIKMI